MKERESQHEHYLGGHKDDEDVSKLAEKLAPPEEADRRLGSASRERDDDGSLVVDTGGVKFPPGLENQQEKRGILGLEPVIVVVLTLMLLFIAFIAYLVYLTPAPIK